MNCRRNRCQDRFTANLRWSGYVLFVVLLLTASQSNAAPRYNKREVKVESTKRRFTEVAAKGSATGITRPGLHAEAFRQAIEAKVSKLTDAAIATLKRLIRVTDDSDPERPDFLFRLAEHYRDKKVEYMFHARELDEQIFQAQTPARKAKLKELQKRYEDAEKKWLIASIKLYLQITDKPEYAHYKRMDEVLYNLADLLTQAKRRDRARIFFGELIRNYPDSKYIPDAYLSFAEYYFNEGEVEQALKLYQRVAKYEKSPLYGYAVYKQAWCWINLKAPRTALDLFVKVIREGNRWAGSKKSRIVLVKEAKKDSVRAYALVGGTPDRAWPFFRRIGGAYAMNMLQRLAIIYIDQGKFDFAIRTYKKLIALDPRSDKLCNWQYSIVRATLSGKPKPQQVVEVKRLAAVYGALKKRGKIPKQSLQECHDNAAGMLRELATLWHNEAQKTRNQDTYALAQYMYKEYLESFPNEKDAYLMSFYYAELLFRLERWSEAAAAYTHVVRMKPDGKYLKEAAYAAVISWKNALNVELEIKDTDTVEPAQKLKPRPISSKYKQMIAAFDTYLKYVPKAKERPAIMYRKARIYYEHNHFDRAAKLFAAVVMAYPDNELAQYSANLLLDSLNALERYDELLKWVGRLRKIPQLMHGDLKETIDRIWSGLERKKLEKQQKEGQYRACGEGYARLATEHPNDERWAELAYNSALCFEAAKLIGNAIKIRAQLIQAAPKHPLAQKAMYMIGANYHALAWYSKAAEWYERFAKAFPGEEQAPEALQNAIVFRLGRTEYDKAADDIRFFAKTYGKRPKYAAKTADVVYSAGVVFEHRKDPEGLIAHYKRYLRDWGRYGGVDREIVAHTRIGDALWHLSCPIKGVNGACIKIERVRSKRTVRKGGKRRHKGIELRKQCGPETKNKITVVNRDPSKMRQAMKHFKEAIALSRRGLAARVKSANKSDIERRQSEMQSALAEARFRESEAQFEKFLQLQFPSGLDFSDRNKKKKKQSEKEFRHYLTTKGKLLAAARKSYQDVIRLRVASWAIAAAARIGQLFQNFADALYTASVPKPAIPKALRRREQREEFMMAFTDAYCDTLEDKARPLEQKAKEGLAACLQRSTELSWYNEWSKLCESELNQIDAVAYPIASEIRAEPGYLSLSPAESAVITEVN